MKQSKPAGGQGGSQDFINYNLNMSSQKSFKESSQNGEQNNRYNLEDSKNITNNQTPNSKS